VAPITDQERDICRRLGEIAVKAVSVSYTEADNKGGQL
jgi:hypothetical protein